MKKLIIIILIFISACDTLRIRLGSPETKKHTETGEAVYSIGKNELAWSRLNHYLFIYMGYPQLELYNPYILHVINEKPYKEITVAREIREKEIKIMIRYTTYIEAKYNEDYSNEDTKFDADITLMKNLVADMLEYAESGKHKYKIKDDEQPATKTKNKKLNSKDHFFFY